MSFFMSVWSEEEKRRQNVTLFCGETGDSVKQNPTGSTVVSGVTPGTRLSTSATKWSGTDYTTKISDFLIFSLFIWQRNEEKIFEWSCSKSQFLGSERRSRQSVGLWRFSSVEPWCKDQRSVCVSVHTEVSQRFSSWTQLNTWSCRQIQGSCRSNCWFWLQSPVFTFKQLSHHKSSFMFRPAWYDSCSTSLNQSSLPWDFSLKSGQVSKKVLGLQVPGIRDFQPVSCKDEFCCSLCYFNLQQRWILWSPSGRMSMPNVFTSQNWCTHLDVDTHTWTTENLHRQQSLWSTEVRGRIHLRGNHDQSYGHWGLAEQRALTNIKDVGVWGRSGWRRGKTRKLFYVSRRDTGVCAGGWMLFLLNRILQVLNHAEVSPSACWEEVSWTMCTGTVCGCYMKTLRECHNLCVGKVKGLRNAVSARFQEDLFLLWLLVSSVWPQLLVWRIETLMK